MADGRMMDFYHDLESYGVSIEYRRMLDDKVKLLKWVLNE
jgi:hypothetical protein